MYMYICMYVCMYVHMCIRVCVYVLSVVLCAMCCVYVRYDIQSIACMRKNIMKKTMGDRVPWRLICNSTIVSTVIITRYPVIISKTAQNAQR